MAVAWKGVPPGTADVIPLGFGNWLARQATGDRHWVFSVGPGHVEATLVERDGSRVAHPWRQGRDARVRWRIGPWDTRSGLTASLATSPTARREALDLISSVHYRPARKGGALVLVHDPDKGTLLGAAQLQIFTRANPLGRSDLAAALGRPEPTGKRSEIVDELRVVQVSRVGIAAPAQGTGVATRLLQDLVREILPGMVPLFPRSVELMRRPPDTADEDNDGYVQAAGFIRSPRRSRRRVLYYYALVP